MTPEPEKFNVMRPSAVRREGLGQSKIKRGPQPSSEHLHEDAGDEDRGDRHRDETADDLSVKASLRASIWRWIVAGSSRSPSSIPFRI